MTKEQIEAYMADCTLCPRMCHADRRAGEKRHCGFCGMPAEIYAARAALHPWEEPCISGAKGSGTVFFSGCSLRCVYCQNREISRGEAGREISIERLSRIFLELQEKGASNINLVTPTHYVPQIVYALETAKEAGLAVPVVYNSSGYERPETLRLLEGLIDIYLPDFKYSSAESAGRYSAAPDYPEAAAVSLKEMVRQVPEAVFSEDGCMKRGIIVRHLVLPGHVKETEAVCCFLKEQFGEQIFCSILNQYTPVSDLSDFPEINRRLTRREYDRAMRAALDAGIENGFFQEGETAKESFIPSFTGEGL